MLALRLPSDVADGAAAGWDGGGYRAFTDGRSVVVALRTAWDSAGDARAFAAALRRWVRGSGPGRVEVNDASVTGVFAGTERLVDVALGAAG